MTAAERERPENPSPLPGRPFDMDDSPEALAPAYPLHEALLLSQQLLVSTHERSDHEAARLASRVRNLNLWSSWAGVAALALIAVETSLSALVGTPSAGLASSIRIGEGAAAVTALGALAWGAFGSASKKAILERHRAERCRLLKFRFLIDPNLWTRRGKEASERRERFQGDAGEIQSLTADRLDEWASRDTVTFAPTLPVGSGIDPHTVHTLVDYYQERRLNPHLEGLRLAIGKSSARDGLRQVVSSLFFAAVALAAVHVFLELPFLDLASPPRVPRTIWSAVAAAIAVVLPAVALALRLSRKGSAFDADRARLAGMRHSLSELSARLQKASGAEAIFRELGFCEDVLETHHREWLRAMPTGA
jgi:hypothetical protein